jgi:hypothetical protein
VDGRDGRVLELAGNLGVVDEPPGGGGLRSEPVVQDLDRHGAAEGSVGGPVDDAHSPAGDLVEEDVPFRRRWEGRG